MRPVHKGLLLKVSRLVARVILVTGSLVGPLLTSFVAGLLNRAGYYLVHERV